MAKRAVGRADVYPNRAFFSVLMSAANALTFTPIRFGTGIFQGTALIISRLDWYVQGPLNEVADTSDEIAMALTNRDDLVALKSNNMNILALNVLNVFASGTPASAQIFQNPMISDFSGLPGGGLIFPANPLFMALHSTGLASAAEVDCMMYYTTKTLADADYIELVQSLIPVNI